MNYNFDPTILQYGFLLICFFLLLMTHMAAIAIGFHMGQQTNKSVDERMSIQTKEKKDVKPYHDGPDIFNEQTLDFE